MFSNLRPNYARITKETPIDETESIKKTIYFLDAYRDVILKEVERRHQKSDVPKSDDFIYCVGPECDIYPRIGDDLFTRWQSLNDEQKREYAKHLNECCECWHQRMCGKDKWITYQHEKGRIEAK